MELTCKQCNAKYRVALTLPLSGPVRVACPSCQKQAVLRPATGERPPISLQRERESRKRIVHRAVIADEPREFRSFLGDELRQLGFEVNFFDSGEGSLEFIQEKRPELVVLNVYLRGRLGVEISEEIRKIPELSRTRIVLIGALFRANRFRANPTNLYGADEYIEDQIPAKELRQIVGRLFPELFHLAEVHDSPEADEARRLARLILSDIVIYNAERVDSGIREGTFFDILKKEIDEGRQYYETRVSDRIRTNTSFFDETLNQFVQMKREELERMKTGTEPNDR